MNDGCGEGAVRAAAIGPRSLDVRSLVALKVPVDDARCPRVLA